jgi:two-component system NtrC family sensor kinase
MRPATESVAAIRALRRRIVALLLGVALLPLALTGVGAFVVFSRLLEAKALELQRAVVRTRADSLESYLTRQRDLLRLLAQSHGRAELCDLERLRLLLDELNEVSHDGFVDLGVIGADGAHLAYAGPYDLRDRNYQDADWFQETMLQGEHTSDVFLGFRQVAHVVVAVRRHEVSGTWILRATINSAVLDALVATSALGETGQAFLVNREGLHQTAPRQGAVLDPAPIPMSDPHSGVRQARLRLAGRDCLLTTVWVNSGRWMLAVRQDADEVRAPVVKALAAGGTVAGIAFLLVVAATSLATRHLTRRIERADARREEATRAFLRSAKLASVGELATGLAHEINNPLAIISVEQTNISDLLKAATLQPEARDELESSAQRIRRQVRRCAAITAKMLEFARKHEAALEPTALGPLLNEIVSLLERQAAVRNVRILTDVPDGVPQVQLDPLELEQVLINLINNSIQAMPRGGTIHVAARPVADEVWLEVQDDGQGMVPEVRDRAFEPFFTTKPVGKGTGLGLSVCYGIVQSWGGRLEVESEPGRGTTMRLRLQAAEHAVAPGAMGACDGIRAEEADGIAGG